MDIKHRSILVTGAASGLGAAVARMAHAAGARVLIADRNREAGEALAVELGEDALFSYTDVSDAASAEATVAQAVSRFGGIDILVNCAGIVHGEKVVGRDGPHALESFRRVIEVNLLGTFNMIRLAAAQMSKQDAHITGERGVIVNTASVAAFDGQMGQAAYTASKAGIAGMTLPIARDLARNGIRVMTVAPGIFRTPMMSSLPQDVQDALGAAVPFPSRLGEPVEFAQLVAAIIANPMLNGETIRLDGAIRLAPK